MPKIISILSSLKIMFHEDILKLNFWLVIRIAKDFVWTTLKVVVSRPNIVLS